MLEEVRAALQSDTLHTYSHRISDPVQLTSFVYKAKRNSMRVHRKHKWNFCEFLFHQQEVNSDFIARV